MGRVHSVIGALIGLAFLCFQFVRDDSTGWTVQENLVMAVGGLMTIFVVVVCSYLVIARYARAAAGRLRREYPGALVLIARGDDYFLGSIAQLRPDIVNPMQLGRWLALVVLDDRFELWGGRGGAEQLLRVPWRFVDSTTVDEIRELSITVAGLVIVLEGAALTPLRLALRMRGVTIPYVMSLKATARIASAMNEFRARAPLAVTDGAGGDPGVR